MIDLHCGDCLEVMATLPDASVDAVICDPPYGTTACKWDSPIPFAPMWEQVKRLIKPRGTVVLFGSQPFTSALVMSNPKWFKYSWVWHKKRATGGANAEHQPMKSHEDLCVFAPGTPVYNPQMEDLTTDDIKRMRKHDVLCFHGEVVGDGLHVSPGWYEGRKKHPRTVIEIVGLNWNNPEKVMGQHPTQKPVALLSYLVKTYTNEGDTVLDFTFGSCTTGVACIETGRNFIGIEKELEYFKIGQERTDKAASALHQLELA